MSRLFERTAVSGSDRKRVFFRLDDVGRAKSPLRDVLSAFVTRHIPIHCSVIPGLLQNETASYLLELLDLSSGIEIGQHGWMHANYYGKGEFGSNRSLELQLTDIAKGMQVIKRTFGDRQVPVFTPPYGRWTRDTLRAISQLGFSAISCVMNNPKERWLGPVASKLGIRRFGTAMSFPFLIFSHHPGPIPSFTNIVEISTSVDTLLSYNPVRFRSAKSVLSSIARSFCKTSIVGVLLHPQYFSDRQRIEYLNSMLDLVCSSQDFEVTSLFKIRAITAMEGSSLRKLLA